MKDPRLNISDIARSVGYEPLTFSKAFHRIMDIARSHYWKINYSCETNN